MFWYSFVKGVELRNCGRFCPPSVAVVIEVGGCGEMVVG